MKKLVVAAALVMPALGGCVTQQEASLEYVDTVMERVTAKCTKIGYQPGTQQHADCTMLIARHGISGFAGQGLDPSPSPSSVAGSGSGPSADAVLYAIGGIARAVAKSRR